MHHLSYWLGAAGLLDLIAEKEPDVVVSTYPGVTAVLGMLRENRRLPVPVQSAITDLAGLRYWAHPGVDLHFVTHPESIEEVERLVGPGTVEWMRPPIDNEFLMPRTRAGAREALGVPVHARLVLVSGGGWGIGDLEGAIRSALAVEDTLVTCIAGRNDAAREKLEQRFGDNDRVQILGFTEEMSDWMAAADAMVHSTAGLTVLEAHIRGCPVISYGFSPGHLRANNAAFERFGLAEVARSEHELVTMLRHTTRQRTSPDSSFASLPPISQRVLAARPRVRQQPVWRVRAERTATAVGLTAIVAAIVIAITLSLNWDGPYHAAAKIVRPIESRVHFGKDEDSQSKAKAAAANRNTANDEAAQAP
jgi:UDP-N-acetylglucosamine:LPS N-acetylglucosamine transferase